jgi:hypothetical protein
VIGARKWSKELIIQQIKELHEKGVKLSQKNMKKIGCYYIYKAALKYFGGWLNALYACGVPYNKQTWSKGLILKEIKRIKLSEKRLSAKIVKKINKELYTVACKRFGSWENTIAAVKLSYKDTIIHKRWNRDIILKEIKKLIDDGEDVSLTRMKKTYDPLYKAALRYFSTWENAIKCLGVDYEKIKKLLYWDKNKVIEELNTLHNSGTEINYITLRTHYMPLYRAACRHFGSLESAIEESGLEYDRIVEQWDKDKVAEQLTNIFSANPEMKKVDIVDGYCSLVHAAKRYFGSFAKALEYIKVDYVDNNCYGTLCFDKLGNSYVSILEKNVGNYLNNCFTNNKITYIDRQTPVCKGKRWSCDFTICLHGKILWLEVDGLGKQRTIPYGPNHPKIKYYIDNNFNFLIIKNVKEITHIIDGEGDLEWQQKQLSLEWKQDS